MELHLVHYNGAFADSSSALASGAKVLEDRSPCPCPAREGSKLNANAPCGQDALAVVGLLFEVDDAATPNPALDQLINHFVNVTYAMCHPSPA
jgi:hypothetical protein